nr:hydroxysqualene dehydroxylase HpnE [uncultured Rhodopila sp.]
MSKVHVIGAGLAGLAAALSLTKAGRAVIVHEAGAAGGGRCRSYFDREIGLRIDNGNHLLLSGNTAARAYIAETGAAGRFHIPDQAVFPFLDIKSGERWTVHPNSGRIPWWMFVPHRRVPGTRLADYLDLIKLVRCRDDTPVAESVRPGELFRRLVEPLAVAALNTSTAEGLARLLGAVVRETLMQGGAACRPMLPKQGLSEALVEPAIATLRTRGAEIRFNSRIAELTIARGTVAGLRGPAGSIALEAADAVVLAVPPWVAGELLPGLVVPDAFEAILNIHYRHAADKLREPGLIGLISGAAEWVFVKPGHVSVTISAANRMVDESADAIALRVWPDVVDALGLDAALKAAMPPYRVVKERRATFAATAAQDARRPRSGTKTAANLALAGDWTNTGLPATIEGAIRSGRLAADVILSA